MPALVRRPSRADAWAVAGLVVLPFAFFWDFVLGRAYLHYLDFTLQWLPWQKFVLDSLRRGEAPFWNPYLMLGFSQVGESQVGMFYPLNILTAFVDLNFRLVLLVCLHLALANAGMYWLLRRFGLGLAPALIGAVSFGLSGYMVAQTTNYVVIQCSARWSTLSKMPVSRRRSFPCCRLLSLPSKNTSSAQGAGASYRVRAEPAQASTPAS